MTVTAESAGSGEVTTTPALEVRGLEVFYGPAQAVFPLDLSIAPGETVGLLGRNGAGKTSTMLGILGVDVRRKGSILLGGRDISGLSVHRAARRGMAWVPDDRRVFPSLTVRGNFEVARTAARRRTSTLTDDELVDIFPILSRIMDRRGGVLSGGEQQIVSIARSLIARPEVVLIDEPTEGLAPVIVAEVIDALQRMRSELHQAVLLAEADQSVVREVASRVVLLNVGRTVFTGPTAELTDNAELQRRYLSLGVG